MIRALLRRRVRAAGGGGVFDVALSFSRLAAGTATTRVFVGIPLQPGQLMPGGAKRIEVAGVEIAATFQETAWRHADGSVAVIRAQCDRTLTNGAPESATLKLGSVAALTGPTWVAPVWPTVTSANYQATAIFAGIGLPTSAAQLCTSRVFGPHLPQASTPASPTSLTGVQAILTDAWDGYYNYWQNAGANPSPAGGMQYDRPALCLQQWARTGQLVWMQRALATYAFKRATYDAPNNWSANEAYAETYSISLMDAMFGETNACWDGVADLAKAWSSVAYSQWVGWGVAWSRILTDSNGGTTPAIGYSGELATSCRAICYNFARISSLILAGRGSTSVTFEVTAATVHFPLLLNRWLDSELFSATAGSAAGLRNIVGSVTPGTSPFVGAVQNFQQGLTLGILHDILHWHGAGFTLVLRDKLVQRMRDLTEYLWTEYRTGAVPTLFYTDVSASHGGRNDFNPDSNGWYAMAFYWMFAQGYGTQWRDRGDLMFDGLAAVPRDGTSGPYVRADLFADTVAQKHLNQIHQYGLRGIALRGGVV